MDLKQLQPKNPEAGSKIIGGIPLLGGFSSQPHTSERLASLRTLRSQGKGLQLDLEFRKLGPQGADSDTARRDS